MSLPLTPPKGTQDRYPEEYHIRSSIFNKRRQVCQSYGYQEYLAPLVENAELYRAKSGDDVGGAELTLISDRGGRDIAIRPEMTPSVTRMVAAHYPQLPKPIRRFNIANFYRNERPQRGRNREFWQLNVDCFGTTSLNADIETMQMALDLILIFNPPKNSFSLKLNHRDLINNFLALTLTDTHDPQPIIRLMDKFSKISEEKFLAALEEQRCTNDQIKNILSFMKTRSLDELLQQFPSLAGEATQQIQHIISSLRELGYDQVQFTPWLMRGFDYYDGVVFEIFDHHPDNNRALFGGGRYNGLAGIFGKDSFPAVGFAPGDETFKIFLESRGLLDQFKEKEEIYYVPLLDETLALETAQVAQKLRNAGLNVVAGLEKQTEPKARQQTAKQWYTAMIGLQIYPNNPEKMVIINSTNSPQMLDTMLTMTKPEIKNRIGDATIAHTKKL